jgi:hypothetical protein
MSYPVLPIAASGSLPCMQSLSRTRSGKRLGEGCSYTQKLYPLPTSPCMQGEGQTHVAEVWP